MGGFWATDNAQNRDSRIFWNSMVCLQRIKSQTLYAMTSIRDSPQRLDYKADESGREELKK